MSCEEFQEKLLDAGRGLEDPASLGHARDCEACERALVNQRMLSAGLRAIARSETAEPPRAMEAELMARFDRPRRIHWVRWAAVAGAAALLAWVFFPAPTRRVEKPLPVTAVKAAAPVWVAPVERVSARPPGVLRGRSRAVKNAAVQAEVEAPFALIPYAAPLLATERAEIVRVNLSASALATMGVPVWGADPNMRLNAELVLGENGLARAVRLVQ